MIQARWRALGVALLSAAVVTSASCTSREGGPSQPVIASTHPPATFGADPGVGSFTLDGQDHALTVTSCDGAPTIDPATGVTSVFVLEATGPEGSLEVTRQQTTTGAAVTTTDSVTWAPLAGDVVQAQRAALNGAFVDLREPGVGVALLDIVDDGVTGTGRFGPAGAVAGDPGLATGTVVAHCP